MRPWSILVLCAVAAVPAVARADVVLLVGNDVPLTGEILSEDRTAVFFRIRGMTREERIRIQKSRIRRYWREEQTAWERAAGPETAEFPGLAALVPPPPSADPSPAGTSKPEAPLERGIGRLMVFVPEDPGLRILFWLAGFGALSLLFHFGGRLAELDKMRLGRGAVLALVSQFLLLLGILAYRSVPEPMTFPLLVSGLIVVWVLVAHMLGGDRVSKAVLLLSFCVASLLLVVGSLFSVLTVL